MTTAVPTMRDDIAATGSSGGARPAPDPASEPPTSGAPPVAVPALPSGPFHLPSTGGPVFAWAHRPAGDEVLATGVLLCPPWGWSEVASYRSRRAWADELAAGGRVALRIDLPATGDSAGLPSDPDLVEAWIDAVRAGVDWLRTSGGSRRVAVIGLGVGGLLAAAALERGTPIDDLVLWSTPAHGRAFARQQRAFAALQGSRFSLTGEPEPQLLPDGWLEVNGFVLSAPTIAALGSIDLATLDGGTLRRALLLEADGIPIAAAVPANLAGRGVEVTAAAGPGYASMCFHPERFEPPIATMAAVGAWLDRGDDLAPGRPSPPPVTSRFDDPAFVALDVGGVAIRETPMFVARPFGRLFGVLAEPAAERDGPGPQRGGPGPEDPRPDGPRPGPDAPAPAPLTAVFLNAGAVRRIGPNRLFVEAARQWAARGVPTLRVDLEGIGDADGDPARYRNVGEFYRPDLEADVIAFLDALVARGRPDRFILAGLCAGGFWSFNAAAVDRRVALALLLNPGALAWDSEVVQRRDAERLRRLADPRWWGRLVRGQVRLARIRAIARAAAKRGLKTATSRAGSAGDRTPTRADRIERAFDRLASHGTRVVVAFSEDEALHDELERDGVLGRIGRWPNVTLDHLPARDHTLRPIVAQRAVHALLDAELTRALAEVARTDAAGDARAASGHASAPSAGSRGES